MKKTYKKVLPCGVLRINGDSYWLLSPSPVMADSWQHKFQQRWSVVPFIPDGKKAVGLDEMEDQIFEPYYSYARHLVCTNPVIEYRPVANPISIEVGYLEDDIEIIYETVRHEDSGFEYDDNEEPEYIKKMAEIFFQSVGAKPKDE